MCNMKKIPELPKTIIKEKLNYIDRYGAWLMSLRKYEKEDELTVCSSREELADFLGEGGTTEIFVVDYRVHVGPRKTSYGVHFYFEPFDKAYAVLVGYNDKSTDAVLVDIKDTPLSRWEIYSGDDKKISLSSTWEYTYGLLAECVEYFRKLN